MRNEMKCGEQMVVNIVVGTEGLEQFFRFYPG